MKLGVDEYLSIPVIKVYNTLSSRLEEFKPIKDNIVKMYVCGPTVYDSMHVGHARTYVAFDIIRRYLEHRGYKVFMVINITDIDDKIINRANELGKSWDEIVSYYTEDFFKCLETLNIRSVYAFPRVTEHISDIINLVQALMSKGYAYLADDGSIYFSIDKVKDYGILSGQRLESLIAGARVEVNPYKRNPLDFALWKAWKPKEPWWSSPWGPGRPGWHIECVAMSVKYLGVRFDIHGGGQDLVFPHHENELAIAKAYLGSNAFARYWLHTGLVTIKGEKMSKSLGNIIPLEELLKKYNEEVLRLYLASVHYRKPLDFKFEVLDQYREVLNTLYTAHDYLISILRDRTLELYELSTPTTTNNFESKIIDKINLAVSEFEESMSNDFNTPQALSALIKLAKICINISSSEEQLSDSLLLYAYGKLKSLSNVFGVLSHRMPPIDIEKLIYKAIGILIEVRSELRKRKLWELSDKMRSELNKMGIVVSDLKTKSLWRWQRNI